MGNSDLQLEIWVTIWTGNWPSELEEVIGTSSLQSVDQKHR